MLTLTPFIIKQLRLTPFLVELITRAAAREELERERQRRAADLKRFEKALGKNYVLLVDPDL